MAVREIRLQRRLSQEQLADRAGIHPTEVSHIESGRRNLSFHSLKKLSDGLQMPLNELVACVEKIESELGS